MTNHIAIVDLNGPESGTEGIRSVSGELSEACSGISWEEEVRVVVVAGSGNAPFSWGEEYRELAEAKAAPSGPFRSPSESLAGLELPVIVGIRGNALGSALEMALACDIRIASEGSRFGMPQVAEGYLPCDGGTQRLSRLVGKGKAMEMILTGETIDASEALRIGLVNKVVPEERVADAALEMAAEMASRAPIAMRYAKEAVLKGTEMTLEQGLRLEADLYFLLHTTADRHAGITAFRAKNKASFDGK